MVQINHGINACAIVALGDFVVVAEYWEWRMYNGPFVVMICGCLDRVTLVKEDRLGKDDFDLYDENIILIWEWVTSWKEHRRQYSVQHCELFCSFWKIQRNVPTYIEIVFIIYANDIIFHWARVSRRLFIR